MGGVGRKERRKEEGRRKEGVNGVYRWYTGHEHWGCWSSPRTMVLKLESAVTFSRKDQSPALKILLQWVWDKAWESTFQISSLVKRIPLALRSLLRTIVPPQLAHFTDAITETQGRVLKCGSCIHSLQGPQSLLSFAESLHRTLLGTFPFVVCHLGLRDQNDVSEAEGRTGVFLFCLFLAVSQEEQIPGLRKRKRSLEMPSHSPVFQKGDWQWQLGLFRNGLSCLILWVSRH